MGALGLMAAFLATGMLSWLGALTGERAAHRIFSVLGLIVGTCLCVLASGLVARMTTTQLLENRRAEAAEMRRFARENWTTLVGIPLAFGSILLLLLVCLALLALVGAVPGVGPLIYSASFLLAFGLSLTVVLITAIHMVGAFLYPPIVAIRGVGAVGALLEVIDLARQKPLYLLLYEIVVAAVGTLMTLLIGLVAWTSLRLTNWIASSIMGDKYDQSLAAIPDMFRMFLRPFAEVLPLTAEGLEVAWHYDLSGFMLGASLLVVVVLTVTYPFVFFTSAGSITYLILRTEPTPDERDVIEDL